MKLLQTLALGFAAMALWNCDDAARPTSAANAENVPAVVNSISKYAALSSGYEVSSATPANAKVLGPNLEHGIPPETFQEMRNLGICENFVLIAEDLFQEFDISGQSRDPEAVSARFLGTVKCLIKEMKPVGGKSIEVGFDLLDKCFCAGQGSLFALGLPLVQYTVPGSPGGRGYSAPTISTGVYGPPVLPGYSPPATPGGTGYSTPSL